MAHRLALAQVGETRRVVKSKKRRQPKRNATSRPLPATPRVRLAIATSPQGADGISLAHDIQLVRAAILYADEVELLSPAAEMIGSLAPLAGGDDRAVLEFFVSLDDATIGSLGAEGLPPNWRELMRVFVSLDESAWSTLVGLVDPASAHDVAEQRQGLDQVFDELRGVTAAMLDSSGIAELVPAIEHGLLRLTPVARAGDSTDRMIEHYTAKLTGLLRNPRVHLLVDEMMGSIARGLLDEGLVKASAVTLRKAGTAAVGSGLIARLPAFDQVPMDELLDLRGDLTVPLARYRKSTSELANRLIASPLDAVEVSADVDDLYASEVEPALLDLREAMAEHGLVREVVKALGTDVRSVISGTAGSAVVLGAASVTGLSGLVAAIPAAGTAALGVVQPLAQAAITRRAERVDAERHGLFYLYEINRRSSA